MPNNVAAFAIHADDVARARRFYEAVFGWKFEPWGPPDFYLIHTGDERQPGVQGLMHKRQQPKGVGGPNCFECTISVDDVDAIADRGEESTAARSRWRNRRSQPSASSSISTTPKATASAR